MSSKPIETPPKDKPAPPKAESHAESHKEQSKPDSGPAPQTPQTPQTPQARAGHAEEHAEKHAESAAELNQGRVHPELPPVREPEKARLHMDQIDAVATPQGVVLFALTEGGEIWQLTTPGGQPVWNQILTPEAPAEDA